MEQQAADGLAVAEGAHWSDWYAQPPAPPAGTWWEATHARVWRRRQKEWSRVRRWTESMLTHHTRLAANPPANRAWHLVDMFPEAGESHSGRQTQLALALGFVLAMHHQPKVIPNPVMLDELVATGYPSVVDAMCAELDRAARRHLGATGAVTHAQDVLAGLASGDGKHARLAAHLLHRVEQALQPSDYRGYTVEGFINLDGALDVLDLLVCSTADGHPPGACVVAVVDGEQAEGAVDRCLWGPIGAPTSYVIRVHGSGTVTVPADQVTLLGGGTTT
ncbi:hypothetical protein M8C13_04620 [Crossiella sp. SN42]|uniref:hypothetical protein n=1 Tax=Crossiella sp. SN42 TaxID=2944808 RepID=UPI00207D3F46|nr:hypothetical protein [Crossiella sp. SN42]MCO1575043.1 hypothetical protein [Crossiella sp. SN42]